MNGGGMAVVGEPAGRNQDEDPRDDADVGGQVPSRRGWS